MPSIIAYAYEADLHCPRCTKRRFPDPGADPDEHGVAQDATDREGNVISAVFTTDEVLQDLHCSQCGDIIAETAQI